VKACFSRTGLGISSPLSLQIPFPNSITVNSLLQKLIHKSIFISIRTYPSSCEVKKFSVSNLVTACLLNLWYEVRIWIL
jgi:hypothetical protein